MKLRTILALAAAAAASAFAVKAVRERRAAEEDVTLELSPEHVASYDPETDTVTPATDEAQEEEEVDPLAMAKAVDFAGKGSEEAPQADDAGEGDEVDPMKLAQSVDFSGDWEDIGCKG